MLLEKVVDIHPCDAQQLAHVSTSETAYPPSQLQQRALVCPGIGAEARREAIQHGMQRLGKAMQQRNGIRSAGLEYQRIALLRQYRGRHIACRKCQPVLLQPEIPDEALWHRIQEMSAPGCAKPGRKLASYRSPAD